VTAPRAHALGHPRARREILQDRLARGDVALLVVDTAGENAAGRRLVDRIGAREMIAIGREQVGLHDAVDAHEALDGLIGPVRVLDRVHERGDRGVRRLRHLRARAKLGKPLAEGVAVLGQVPHVPAHQELGRELGSERDPAAEGAHGALDDVAVIAKQARGVLCAERAFERLRHARQ